MSLTEKQIQSYFPSNYVQRGLAYFKQDCVLDCSFDEQTGTLQSSVRGSGNRRYQCLIELQEDPLIIDGRCSCPVGYNCKHVVATLLHHLQRKPDVQQDMFGQAGDQWLYRVKQSRVKADSEDYPERLIYVLDKYYDAAGAYISVDSYRARMRKDGSLSQPTRHTRLAASTARYMRDEDRYLLPLLNAAEDLNGRPRLEGKAGVRILQMLLDSGRSYWGDIESPVLHAAPSLKATLGWQMDEQGRQQLEAQGLDSDCDVLPLQPPHYIDVETGACGELDCGLPAERAALMLSMPPIPVQDVDQFNQQAAEEFAASGLPLPESPEVLRIDDLRPEVHLQLTRDPGMSRYAYREEGEDAFARLTFLYDGNVVSPLDDRRTVVQRHGAHSIRLIERDTAFEESAVEMLEACGLVVIYIGSDERSLRLEGRYGEDSWLSFMIEHHQRLMDQGWHIKIDDDFPFHIDEADDWYAQVEESGVDWFNLELGVRVKGEVVNLLPFLVSYLRAKKNAHSLEEMRQMPDDFPLVLQQDNGRLLRIPLHRVRGIIGTLTELYSEDSLDRDGRLKLSRFQSNQLALLDDSPDKLIWQGGDRMRRLGRQLHNFEGIREVKPPTTLKAELRDYQRQGLNWLQFLRSFGLGGILADDMGLGKTVQTLAHLLVEKRARRADRPSLVVAPTSLMVNWRREAKRFAPGLKVQVLHGPQRSAHFSTLDEYDLLLTTYALLSRDRKVLLDQEWHVVILDEAQHIKNARSKAAQTARELKARQRLCLTGTPMENHLGELWSQFHFLMPGLLGDEKRFRKLFRNPVEKHGDHERQQQLSRRVHPFMLRREKAEVATELPPKTEIVSAVEMDGAQRDLYETIRVAMSDKVRREIDARGIARSHLVILDALLKLRQVCCHPQLLKLPSAAKVKQSAKLDQLMEMLPEMVEEGRRILLFSQFTSMLAMIEQELQQRDIDYVKLTGRTRDRATPVDRFQSGEVPVFLISLKAGGAGLNLTAADTVIHYDPWWNPAAENQATDRAYRIGQDKPVFVYKMVASGSVEEKIIAMQQKKQALADALFSGEGDSSRLSADDLQGLFEPLA